MPKSALKQGKASSKSPTQLLAASRLAGLLLGGAYLAWILVFPAASGIIGRAMGKGILEAFGWSAYLLPVLVFCGSFQSLRGELKRPAFFVFGSAVAVASAAVVLGHVGTWTGAPVLGGLGGAVAGEFLARWLGAAGSFLLGAALLLVSSQAIFAVSWPKLALTLYKVAKQDYREWIEARKALAAADGPIPAAASGNPAKAVAGPPAAEPERRLPEIRQPRQEKAPAEKKAGKLPAKETASAYKLPGTGLLEQPSAGVRQTEDDLMRAMQLLETTLANFGVSVKATGCNPGPVITQYELEPAPGVKVSSIVSRSNDLALALRARSVRIVAPIPGKAAVGIEIPNPQPAKVVLREILESPAFQDQRGPLGFTLGKTVDGTPAVAEISSMPHLLVAGATNSGKSVLIHSLILSILYRSRPEEVKLLLIDPKRLELTFYEGVPHLYDPRVPAAEVQVLTQPKDAAKSLQALLEVMSDRYEKYKTWGVRNIEGFNEKAAETGMPRDYYVVVVIDELADLILVAQKSIEDSIQRLAQMARAVGIHLVLATQRPSTDVITGVIKANLPARIALSVMSQIDSRVILDTQGAETLMGRGDMLYLAAGAPEPVRMQSPFVSEPEITRVVSFWKEQGKPAYQVLVKLGSEDGVEGARGSNKDLAQALKLVLERRRVSQDLLKAHFGSSARATDLLSIIEMQGFIFKPEGTNRWEIYFDKIEDYLRQNKGPDS